MSDGTREYIIGAIGIVAGWLGSVIKGAFAAGKRDAELVSHKQLEEKLKGYARVDQLESVQKSIDALRGEQREDFRTVIELIQGGRE